MLNLKYKIYCPDEKLREEIADRIDLTSWAGDLKWGEIETFAAYTELYRVPEGTVVFREGDREGFMALVSRGSVQICKEGADRERKVLATIGPGKTLGEMSLVDGGPRSATAVTTCETVLHVISEENFARLATEHPRLWGKMLLKIARLISQRLRRTSGRLVDFL